MPKAPPYKIIGPEEYAFGRQFFTKSMPQALGLTVKEEGGLLINEKSKSTYEVIPGVADQGRLVFAIAAGHGVWVALIDPGRSEILLMVRKELEAEIAKAHGAPHAGLLVEQTNQHMVCKLHVEWAQTQGLIKKTAKCKMDGDPFMLARNVALATPDGFVNLHNHSHYSMLDGTMTPDLMAERAVLNGQKAMALTDHGVMFGTWKMYKACKEWGIKPLLGVEGYLVDDVSKRYQDAEGRDRRFEYHITLIAQNMEGWQNLSRLVSRAFRDHYYYAPRFDHKMLAEHSKGVICLTGCFKGVAAWHMADHAKSYAENHPNEAIPYWFRRDPDHAKRWLQWMMQVFPGRVFGELHSNDFPVYMQAMPGLAQMFHDIGLPAVPACDAHYEQFEDAPFQAMLTKISQNKIDSIGDRLTAGGPYYLKCRDEIDPVGIITPEMFARTQEIADMCDLEFPKGFLFPTYNHQQDTDWAAYRQSKGA